MVSPKHRTVILEKRAEVLDSLFKGHSGLEEVYDGIVWRLCRNPESGGMRVLAKDGQSYFVIRAEGWVNVPSLVLLYTFDDDNVTILSAHIVDSGE